MDKANWIDSVLEETDHVETPRPWIFWSLISAISACAPGAFLVTLKGAVVYKPNVYVILLGDSGLGKGFGINLAKILVQTARTTRVVAGRSSIQAIVKELSLACTREGKPPIMDSRGFVVNGELSTAIIQDPSSLTVLTDLYDGHYNAEWTNLLKGSGAEKLKNPYITALFGSSPAHFYETIPQVNIEGGYVGRNLISFEEKRYKDTNLLDDEDDAVLSFPYDKFSPHLELVENLSGRMIPNKDAKDKYNTWRASWRANQKIDKTGFNNRVPDHVLKVAMCLCLADYNTKLVIGQNHIEEAIERVVSLSYASARAAEGKGANPLAAQTKKVLDFLLTAPDNTLSRRKLITKGLTSGDFDSIILDKILIDLEEAGWVTKERLNAGRSSDWIYTMAGEPLEAYRKFTQRGQKK